MYIYDSDKLILSNPSHAYGRFLADWAKHWGLHMESNILMKLLLGAVLIVSLAHVAWAATMTVAASDSSAAARASADYLCDGVDDQQEIQAALNALPATGGEVVLTEGTFRCTGNLAPKAHSTLRGQGDSKTSLVFTNSARILVDKEYVTLEDFSVSGKDCTVNPWGGVITVRASHAAVRDITGTADDSIQGVFYGKRSRQAITS